MTVEEDEVFSDNFATPEPDDQNDQDYVPPSSSEQETELSSSSEADSQKTKANYPVLRVFYLFLFIIGRLMRQILPSPPSS